jgi:hypothetical protein
VPHERPTGIKNQLDGWLIYENSHFSGAYMVGPERFDRSTSALKVHL